MSFIATTPNIFALAYHGDQVLNNPALLSSLTGASAPFSIFDLVTASWDAYLSAPSPEAWTAFSEVLVVADAENMDSDDLVEFGRKWAAARPASTMPKPEVIAMFKPHLQAAGLLYTP